MTSEYLNNKIFESIIAKFQKSKQYKLRYEILIEDLTGSYKKRKSAKKKLEATVKEYDEISREFSESQQDLAIAFYTLSENIVRYAKFNLIDIDDAIQEGVMICFEKIDRFDPNYRGKSGQKAKAFNYMTTCILNHYRQLYRCARNYNQLKKKYHDYLLNQVEKALLRSKVNISMMMRDKYTRT